MSNSAQKIVYNFDDNINRVGTKCMKYDALPILYPDYAAKDNPFCSWVADMDFNACPRVVEEIHTYVSRNSLTLSILPPSFQ